MAAAVVDGGEEEEEEKRFGMAGGCRAVLNG